MVPEKITITAEKCKDAGLALVLICLLCYQVWKLPFLMLLAILFLLIAMTYPPLFKPFARGWFALSIALGTIISKLILALLFYALVYPVGLMRRMMGKDTLQIKSWKQDQKSVFRARDHRYSAADLEQPF